MKKKLLIISLFILPLFGFTQTPLIFFRSNIKADKLLLLPPTTMVSAISKGSIHQIGNFEAYALNIYDNKTTRQYSIADSFMESIACFDRR